MPDLISFDPYLGWVDIEDVDNIPEDARLIAAADLMRFENFGKDGAAAINALGEVATDTGIATLVGAPATDTGTAVAALIAAAFAAREQVTTLATNTTTASVLQSPTGLLVPVTALSVWELDVDLFYGATIANDMRCGWTVPAGSQGRWGIAGLALGNTGLAAGDLTAQSAPIGTLLAVGGNDAATYARFKAVVTVGATAGNIALTFAPDNGSATVTLYQHSILRARRLS